MSTLLLLGNCLDKMAEMTDNSVDCIVTDPPYGLKFMGKSWDYEVPSIEIWKEVNRVLKPGGYLLSFGGTRTYHRMVVAIEDAGFEIRDQIQWIYGSGFPKSLNVGKQTSLPEHEGIGTALKPANEPIVLARKPLSEKTVAENVLKWGTGGLNIDAGRIEGKPRTTHAAGNVVTCQAASGHMKGKMPHGPVPGAQGRFPANILLDECAAEMLDAQSGNCKSRGAYKDFKETAKGMFQGGNPIEPNKYANEQGGASRFFYVAKASKRERGEGNVHPTVKPTKLMEYLIKLVCPPNGTVLDPFMGSGSTGVAAKNLGFNFIGIERDFSYFQIAKRRIG